jgi:hypothetical protein
VSAVTAWTGGSVLPDARATREMLEGLLFRDVTVAPSEPVATGEKNLIGVGSYVDDANRLAAVAVLDLELSAYSAAAIGLVPAGGAEAAIEDRELAPSLQDNLYEVLNVLSALFNVPGAPHLRLAESYPPGEVPSADVAALVRTLGKRLDLSVTVAGYGTGTLSLVLEP